MKVRHVQGDQFEIAIRSHTVVVDQPVQDGGQDTGPTPTELFVASIGSCGAFYGRRFLARHGLPEDIEVEVDWHIAPRPARVARVDLKLAVPGLPPQMLPRFQRVVEGCLVHNTLRDHPAVVIEVVADRAGDSADHRAV